MRHDENAAAEREQARDHPDQTVDELEQRWCPTDTEDADARSEEISPAIEQNLDAQDLGSADAADEPSG